MRRNTVFLLMLLTVSLCLFILPAAAGEGIIPAVPEALETVIPEGMPDIGSVRNGYAERVMEPAMSATSFPASNRDKLTDMEKVVYDLVKTEAGLIANGQRADTVIEVPAETLGLADGWYLDDLGTGLYDPVTGDFDADGIRAGLQAMYADRLDVPAAFMALLYDDPYDFYWMDNNYVAGFSDFWYGDLDVRWTDDERLKILPLSGPAVYLFADTQYLAADCDPNAPFVVDTAKTGTASRAAENAQAIITAAAGMTDMERMTTYMQRIRQLSGYNNEAAAGRADNTSAWQLIWVFDGDPETRVVCEGFAKAFRYLCEHTVFTDRSIRVYIVMGLMDGVPHMWNNVHLPAGNYLVDVTNCMTSGSRTNSLFFSLPESGDPENGYVMVFAYPGQIANRILYQYDESARQLYTAEELTLASAAVAEPEGIAETGINGGIRWVLDTDGYLTLRGTGGIADELFSWRTDIRSVTVGEGITAIGGEAFACCGSLTSVYLPTTVQSIGDYAFYGCTALSTVEYCGSSARATGIQTGTGNEELLYAAWQYNVLPFDPNTCDIFCLPDSLTDIGEEAFYGTDADVIVLPAGAEVHIGSEAFANCGKLKYIIIPASTVTDPEEDAFDGTDAAVIVQ